MTNPAASNSGFSALVASASALANAGSAITGDQVREVGPQLAAFFTGQAFTAGSSGWLADAFKQRTDVCAVPAGGVVGEAVVAFELANAVLEKFGGDALVETRRNLDAFVETLP